MFLEQRRIFGTFQPKELKSVESRSHSQVVRQLQVSIEPRLLAEPLVADEARERRLAGVLRGLHVTSQVPTTRKLPETKVAAQSVQTGVGRRRRILSGRRGERRGLGQIH